MTSALRAISSMATRQLLGELLTAWRDAGGVAVDLESVGGVDAAKRVVAGNGSFDLVFLALDAIERLIDSGHADTQTKTDWALSEVAVAVRKGAAHPDLSSEASLREAVLSAESVGYSTGPSGTALMQLFARWGIAEQIQSRLVQAPAGKPVGALVANGEVALGFQQLSELIHLDGIDVLHPLPDGTRVTTVFSGAVVSGSSQAQEAKRLLAFLASPDTASIKQQQGMQQPA